MRKSSMAICITLMFLLSSLGPALLIKSAQAADPTDWYKTVNGVLDTDTYSLYPYDYNDLLKVGLSKFGELIDSNNNVGLEYDSARDPFAPVAGISVPSELGKHVWINGWYIDIRYNHSVWGYRNVWAGALFADIASYGGPWLRVDNGYGSCTYEKDEAFNLPGKEIDTSDPGNVKGALVSGGRKTNGTVLTDDLQVLYDGPRLFVAKITNHIYDWYEPSKLNRHIVDLVLTVIFNKVKKEVIVLKDVKLVPPAKFEVSPLKVDINTGDSSYQTIYVPVGYLVQLSNREEWDLGTIYTGTTSYSSYVHFYTAGNGEGQSTVYNDDWTMLPTLPPNTKVKGVVINEYGSQPGSSGTYDVAQIISNDGAYVGWHALWPSVSDWSVTAGDDLTWYRALLKADPHTEDGPSEPWRSPLVVGEWDFMLSDQERKFTVDSTTVEADIQFRGVSVYGITDCNDGTDTPKKLDTELLYQLNEIFNPWDLKKAVSKKNTMRWVEYTQSSSWTSTHAPVVNVNNAQWDDYCVFSERVEDLTTGTVLKRSRNQYTFSVDGNGYAHITGLTAGHTYKILYSTNMTDSETGKGVGRYEWIIVGRDAHTVDSAGAAMVAAAFKDKIIESKNVSGAYIGLSGADMFDSVVANQMPWVMHKFTGDTWEDYYYAKGTDYRTALRDDWCRAGTVHYNEWPIASSNMIGVGGPLANLLSYYANDFMTAIFALSDEEKYGAFTDYASWENKIVPLTCWQINKTRAYSSSLDTGYAVISTYKDINGTVIFLVWGHWGRDTYYACKFFHEEIIYELQDAPDGLNSIIIKINYESTSEGYKPTGWSIVECLGTISETLWIHNTMTKGGIHDP